MCSPDCNPQIPLVDLLGEEDEEGSTAALLRSACIKYGFFALTNHGVDSDLLARHMDLQRSFFSLPLKDKMTVAVDSNNRGYTPMGNETLDEKNSKFSDDHEGIYYGRHTTDVSLPLHGPNQWLAEDILPGYRAVTEEYISEMTKLGLRALKLLSKSLHLEQDYFDPFFQQPMIALRPLRYGAIKSDPQAGRFAAGAHTDYGMLTFLYTDGQPGLEIFHKGRWLEVPPQLPGVFVCNLGDMLERWTNGLYKSTLHRVVNKTGHERYSVPFFFEPTYTAVVEPLLFEPDDKPKYPPTTSGEHLLERLEATHKHFQESLGRTA